MLLGQFVQGLGGGAQVAEQLGPWDAGQTLRAAVVQESAERALVGVADQRDVAGGSAEDLDRREVGVAQRLEAADGLLLLLAVAAGAGVEDLGQAFAAVQGLGLPGLAERAAGDVLD